MYQLPFNPLHAAGVGIPSSAAALAFTGMSVVTYLVAAATLVFCGFALLRLVPRREA